ncbi:MAG: hypothetical protein CMN87_17980 [Stappia sp.]|nr:hypothetical protein [Stappia sp.]MBM21895.1 hypothetical protein [Stappia sp.]
MRTGPGRHLRLLAVWAMLIPFVVSSLIGSAVMPAKGADGTLTLVICSGSGMIEIAVDPLTMEPVSESPDEQSPKLQTNYCAWAASHVAIDLPVIAAIPARLRLGMAAMNTPAPTVLRVAAATGLPPATGPPATF